MDDDRRMYWHNFATGKVDYRTAPTTDEEARHYIPQDLAVQNLYGVCRQRGDSVGDASIAVLRAVTGR